MKSRRLPKNCSIVSRVRTLDASVFRFNVPPK
jgi:hypothetical protein